MGAASGYYLISILCVLLSFAQVSSFCSIERISFLQKNFHLSRLQALPTEEQASVDLFNEAKGNVAYVSSLDRAFNPLTFNTLEIPKLSGSGWLWVDRKHIVTNYHVVAARRPSSVINSTVLVTFIDNDSKRTSYKATVVGGDIGRDIALLKVIPENAANDTSSPLPLGTERGTILAKSVDLQVGQRAIAIGSPFGLDHSVTAGIISGLGRRLGVTSVEESEGAKPGTKNFDMIQTDAAINPGNSGGPLLDSSGRVIGMNTAIYSTSGTFAGVGFAIPTDTIKTVVELILASSSSGTSTQVDYPRTGLQLAGGTLYCSIYCSSFLSLSHSITACLLSRTPHDTSLTIISPSIDHQSSIDTILTLPITLQVPLPGPSRHIADWWCLGWRETVPLPRRVCEPCPRYLSIYSRHFSAVNILEGLLRPASLWGISSLL
jgi:S1-C subfamily serine protease